MTPLSPDFEDLSSYFPEAEQEIVAAAVDEAEFNEVSYLLANPDIAEKVTKRELPSGYFHYRNHGKKEGRPLTVNSERAAIDAVVCTPSGAVLVIGWAEECLSEIKLLRVMTSLATTEIAAVRFVRFRRPDVETALGFNGARHFGFFALASVKTTSARGLPSARAVVELEFENGCSLRFDPATQTMEDARLLELILAYLSSAQFCGNPHVETMFALDGGFAEDLVELNRTINRGLISSATCLLRDQRASRPRASIVICLYGKPEFMFLQVSSLFRCLSFAEYELIYVCNSPELLETLLKIADICEAVYGTRITIIGLSGNAGFGGANNVAARYASSDRIIFVNPDVFPVDVNWIAQHEHAAYDLPAEQSRLFGSRLFYADGSLMHAGMYFEIDTGISIGSHEVRQRDMVRVEHYGKGAPPSASRFCGSSVVPAVSGAFISIDRRLFETLNGFSDQVVYGHYEDADLCLRAMQVGVSTWVHDIPMWHLEGKGSTRLPHHEGASLVNRWLFARNWGEVLRNGWLGPVPPALKARSLARPDLPKSSKSKSGVVLAAE